MEKFIFTLFLFFNWFFFSSWKWQKIERCYSFCSTAERGKKKSTTNLSHSKESGKIPSLNEVCNWAISSAWSPCQPQIKLRAGSGVFRFLLWAHSAYSFTTCWVAPAFWSFRIKSKKMDVRCFLLSGQVLGWWRGYSRQKPVGFLLMNSCSSAF